MKRVQEKIIIMKIKNKMNKKDQIDLLYLTNQNFIDKYNQKLDENKTYNKEEIRFYRKRILNTTKDLLRENSINNDIDNSFLNYAQELIKYYKFIDKKDILQEEYKDLKEKPKKKVNPNFKLMENNKLMTKETKKTIRTIKDCLPLKIKTKKQNKTTYPKKKDINIKDPKFRTKGLEKEKSNQFICLEKQKENTKIKKNISSQKKKEGKSKQKIKNNQKIKHKKNIDLISAILGK